MKSIEELELELKELIELKPKFIEDIKSKYGDESWYEFAAKIRSVEKSLTEQIEELKNKAV